MSNGPNQLPLYDAHNHLHDARLAAALPEILQSLPRENIHKMVVNGSCEEDWPAVLALARECSQVIPSFGYHPWYINERSAGWQNALLQMLDQVPSAIGEIGLDRWIEGYDLEKQAEVFVWQLRLAAERNLPVSIHCLQAWGKLLDLLREGPVPDCGFVLHSFGGPPDLIKPLAELGAFFSLPGYFAQSRKQRQREAFREVPPDRFLIETDAPDQTLPPERVLFPLPDSREGKPVNHPANLVAVYQFAAELFNEPMDRLAARVQNNFFKLFGRLGSP